MIKQKQTQEKSNFKLLWLLSLSESIMLSALNNTPILQNYKRKYEVYDPKNNLFNKTTKALENELNLNLVIFNMSYKKYKDMVGTYDLPENIDLKTILKDIKTFKKNIGQ